MIPFTLYELHEKFKNDFVRNVLKGFPESSMKIEFVYLMLDEFFLVKTKSIGFTMVCTN